MAISWSRFGLAVTAIALAIFALFALGRNQFGKTNVAHAGAITSPAWTLSSVTENASNVTYTHTFTTATAIPINGGISIEFRQGQGSFVPLPDFALAQVGSGSTAAFSEVTPSFNFQGGAQVMTLTAKSAATAGTITLVLTGVKNPNQGGVIQTHTTTFNATGAALDGTRGTPDANGKLTVGVLKLSGKITDATTGTGIAGVPLEIHPGPNSTSFGGFWKTTTDSSGNYSFAGVTNGTYVFEMSPFVDPGSSNAKTINEYARFDPVDLTISDTAQTINKALAKSQKIIKGKVVYAGTTDAINGAQVDAGTMGPGGFSNTTTAADGTFTIRMAATGNVFLMVHQAFNFGPPPGQGDSPQPSPSPTSASDFGSTSRQLSFIQAASVAETVDLGNVEVKKTDATVKGKIQNADGSAATGGAGLMNFREHNFTPLQLGSDGSFTAKVVSGSTFKLDSFDPTGAASMPNTKFTAKKGTNDLGTIKKVANDQKVTITAKRIDGTERALANVQAMVFSKEPGPPFFATTDSNGVATVKVPAGFEGSANVMPGSAFGGGPGPKGPGEGEKKIGFEPYLIGIERAMAEETFDVQARIQAVSDATDLAQLFPTTGFQKVKAGDSVTVKFDKADKSVNVRTVDSAGKLVTDGAFVDVRPKSAGFFAHFGCPTAGGLGTCNVVKGDLEFQAMFPPESQFAGKSKSVTITDSGTTVELTVAKKTVTVTGEVRDGSNNNAVIKDGTLQIMIGAFGSGLFTMGQYNPSAGTYSMKIPPDTKVRLGVAAGDPGVGISQGGYIPNIDSSEVSGKDGETVTKHLTLSKVDASISGKVTDQDGKAVEGVTVVADPGLADLVSETGAVGPGPVPGAEHGPEFGFSATTDSDGKYTIDVAPNKYNLIVNARNLGLFAAGVVQVDVKSKDKKTDANISLAKANSTLKVEVNDTAGKDLTGSTVTVFNEKGTIAFETTVDAQGVATIQVPADTYTIKAGKDSPESGKVEESKFAKVICEKDKTLSTSLQTSTQTDALASPQSSEVTATATAEIALNKGATEDISVLIPSGALSSSSSSSSSDSSSSSSGNPLVFVTPLEAELVATKVDQPIKGITINAVDSSGNAITSLTGSASGEIHYADSDLPAGVDEKNLIIKSFNESTGQWEAVQTTAVDTTNNLVSFSTNHFSDFAIVATSDTTAPAAPTDAKASDVGTGGKVKLTWTNPTDSDFDHLNIYRSTTEGELGSNVKTTAKDDTSFEDSSLTNGTKYFYTLRSVDKTGNESANTNQVSATPSKTKTLPKTGNAPLTGTLVLALLGIFGLGLVTNLLASRYARR